MPKSLTIYSKAKKRFKKSAAFRRAYCEKDIQTFASYYLAHHIKFPFGEFHKDWFLQARKKRIALACPRSHAKTTIFSMIYVLWCILYKKKEFIVLISDTSDQSKLMLGSIVEELEGNERIIRDFGNISGYIPDNQQDKKEWNKTSIVTLTNVKVVARGIASKLRGFKHGSRRPDLILLDDVENDENVKNPEQREKYKNVFRKSIMNLGDENTQIIVVGTILHFDSLLNDILNKKYGFYTKLYRAIQSVDGHEEPLWKERWTLEDLEVIKTQITSMAFEQEWMNNPLDEGSQVLKFVSFYDSVDLSFCDCFAYLDLASKEKQENDYSAIATVARDRSNGKLYVVNPQRMRGKLGEILEWFFNYYKVYKHTKIGIESNNFQTWFFQVAQEKSLKEGVYIPMVEIEQIKDKVERAKSMSVYFENGTISTNPNYQDFNAEVEQFPKSTHDDWVDSVVEGVRLAIGQNSGAEMVMTASNKF